MEKKAICLYKDLPQAIKDAYEKRMETKKELEKKEEESHKKFWEIFNRVAEEEGLLTKEQLEKNQVEICYSEGVVYDHGDATEIANKEIFEKMKEMFS